MNKIIDKQGRIGGKVSIIDIALILVIVLLVVGFLYRRFSKASQIVDINSTFYVTFMMEPVRQYSVDAVKEGDIFFQQYAQQPLGTVVKIETQPAKQIIKDENGQLKNAPMDERYRMYITLKCSGNVSSAGYYINGNTQVSDGADMTIQSNMLICAARVYSVSDSE